MTGVIVTHQIKYVMSFQDTKKIGALALADNDPHDKYVYEIVVFTGMKNGASCDSKVSLCLFGERGETGVRCELV